MKQQSIVCGSACPTHVQNSRCPEPHVACSSRPAGACTEGCQLRVREAVSLRQEDPREPVQWNDTRVALWAAVLADGEAAPAQGPH